jgi:hypothetical protein
LNRRCTVRFIDVRSGEARHDRRTTDTPGAHAAAGHRVVTGNRTRAGNRCGSRTAGVPDNGQVDTLPDRETVPFPVAQRIVREIVDTGDADVPWQVDRDPGY